ncbi:gamma carbonic anhydrase family protein [Ramlibacter sp. XY19]|uniref:gamma carbonic anhydrase family protein n=1 Tax=Ramlibacter paludis TaxID=2908000 RepID=UPI0023DAAFA5|nr:gamma carbonic anhydrase family protein [Ramlibacter paludis]MCG2594339.1 gamma carbonic anhydrase family protein [Ramlibacter paludis]
MTQYRIGSKQPQVHASAFVAREATLVGEVIVGEQSSVWFGAVARGDNEPIRLGARCNVQEGAVLHADPGFPLTLADDVSVGHQAMLHGCTVGQGSLVGIQAVVMNGAVIGKESLVGAGALVTEGKVFPDRSLILGSPAKLVRQLSEEDVARLYKTAAGYARRAKQYGEEMVEVSSRA